MKLRFIWAGSRADSEFSEAVDRYLNRIKHFFPIEVTEIRPEKGRQSATDATIIRAQSERLLAAIPDRGYTVVLDERGQSLIL